MRILNIVTTRLALLLVILLFPLTLMAQRERNYIYILDCSRSMVTDYHIWEPTLKYLEEDITRLSDNTMVTIVPFQGTVYEKQQRHERKNQFDWRKFREEVEPIPMRDLTGTNICAAWDRALNYIDPNKDNYLYLLTDGKDNKNGTPAVCQRINEWCNRVRNSHGYFVMLSTEAADESIKKAVNDCEHMLLVDATTHPHAFGSFEKEEMSYNTLDPHDSRIPFSAEGTFAATATSDHPVIKVSLEDGVIKDGVARLHVYQEGSLDGCPDSFPVNVHIASDAIEILNPDLTLMVKNIPERTLQLPAEEMDLGESRWYDAFLWSDAREMDTLTVDLHPLFNASARQMDAHVTLELTETTTDENHRPVGLQSEIFYNGVKCADGQIDIDPGKPAVLSFVQHSDAEEGMHYYQLKAVPHSRRNLESINQQDAKDYEVTLRSEYSVSMNPLKLGLIIAGLILLALLIAWFLVAKPLLIKTFKVFNVTISDPYFKTINIRGAKKVVFTSMNRKQNVLDSLFCGKIIYEVNECWQHECELVPMQNGAILYSPHHFVDPMDSPLEPGVEYKLTDEDDGKNRVVISV